MNYQVGRVGLKQKKRFFRPLRKYPNLVNVRNNIGNRPESYVSIPILLMFGILSEIDRKVPWITGWGISFTFFTSLCSYKERRFFRPLRKYPKLINVRNNIGNRPEGSVNFTNSFRTYNLPFTDRKWHICNQIINLQKTAWIL